MQIYRRNLFLIFMSVFMIQCHQNPEEQWVEDFKYQPVSSRPAMEVNYTDASRTTFQILAEEYHLTGQLEQPHALIDENQKEWLWMEIEDGDGNIYSTRNSAEPSRINLYRRGPYFCEVHWFDM